MSLGLAMLAAGLCFAAEAHADSQAKPRAYGFSPVNQWGIGLTARYWNPIISYVSARSGVTLELKIGRTSADTTALVLVNQVEFVFSNHLFSPERERLGWQVFGRRQTSPIYSQIITLASSNVLKLEDLANQPVGFPGPEALVSYKFSYAQLLQRNVPVAVVFGGNTDGALAQLVSGKVKAVGVNSQLAEAWSNRERQPLRVLWQSPPLHDLALMAQSGIPANDRQAVAAAFLGMLADPVGRQVLASVSELVKLPSDAGFVASDGLEYDGYRKFYATAPAQLR